MKLFTKFLKDYGYIFIFLILSFLPFYIYKDSLSYSYLGSHGDYMYIVDPVSNFNKNSFVYTSTLGGYFNATAISLYMPYYFFAYILGKIGLSSTYITLSFMSSCIFLSQLSFRNLVTYFFPSKKKALLSVLVPILYAFTPYFSNLVLPGHILLLLLPAIFPFSIVFLFKYFKIHTVWNVNLVLFGLSSFLIATVFANLSYFIVYLGSIVIILGVIFLSKDSTIFNVKTFILKVFLIFTSICIIHSFWLVPILSDLPSMAFGEQNQISKLTLGASIDYATRDAYVLGILSGSADGKIAYSQLSGNDTGFYIVSFLYIVMTLLILSVVYRRSNLKIILLIIVFTIIIYFLKGPKPPFASLFDYLYNTVFPFQILRRPASKLYWLYYIIFYFGFYGSVSIIFNTCSRILKNVLYLFIILSSLIFIFYFSQTRQLFPFNIPIEYKDTNAYLQKENVQRVLLLPIYTGVLYDSTLNFLSGVDFLDQVWDFPLLRPDNAYVTPNMDTKFKVNNLYSALYIEKKSDEEVCTLLRELSISHVIFRENMKDLELVTTSKILSDTLVTRSNLFTFDKRYLSKDKPLHSIYKVNPKCVSLPITSDFRGFSYIKLNPTLYKLHFSHVTNPVSVAFNDKVNAKWVIFPTAMSKRIPVSYGNSWIVDPASVKKNTLINFYKTNIDGSIDMDLYMIFVPQLFFYFGIAISGVGVISGFSYMLFLFSKKLVTAK